MTSQMTNILNFRSIFVSAFLVLVALTSASALFFSSNLALGVGTGGIISLVNFFWLHGILQRILGIEISSPARFAITRFILRFALTGIALYYILIYTDASIAGLFAGLSVVVITLVSSLLVPIVRSGG